MAPRRKTPFSGKAKKEQLKEKKSRKHLGGKPHVPLLKKDRDEEDSGEENYSGRSVRLNQQPSSSERKTNRYALQFYKETKSELENRKREAHQTLKEVSEKECEVTFEKYFPSKFDFPKRPPWTFGMSREELDAREHKYFREYVQSLEKEFGSQNLSYFELNLETWRQLWRVLEMSDIVLAIADIRFPALMFPPSVYKFVCDEMKKSMILVLNKIDLAPPDLIVAWKHYFMKCFPSLKIVTFTSFPSYNLRSHTENKAGLQVRRRRGKLRMAAEGAQKLYEVCREMVEDKGIGVFEQYFLRGRKLPDGVKHEDGNVSVDLSSWAEKISKEMNDAYDDDEREIGVVTEKVEDTGYREHVRFKGGTLTIGCIGQPNAGKSSLMNAVMGKKVVSVSRTPGHTKHFQTIYLTSNVILCDCPGLVFPSTVPRTLQILIGAYPIAQVREPFTAVKFLAERMNLPQLLGIRHPENDDTWSAMDICEGWAKKRGFYTAKAARLDSYRAANDILRMALDGKICLTFKPPGYCSNREQWLNHSEVAEIAWIQAKDRQVDEQESEEEVEDEDEDEEEEKEMGKGSSLEEEEVVVEEDEESMKEVADSDRRPFANRFELLQVDD